MKDLKAFRAAWERCFNPAGREELIKDYLVLLDQLVWQRQASFFAAAILAALYFDPILTFATYLVVVLTEVMDMLLVRRAQGWDGRDLVVGRQILQRIIINTIVSAVAISFFVVCIAIQQTEGGHFTPLFILFSASLFAAMYNSQMMGILLLRLSIYACAFLFMAFLDVFRYFPPLSSNIWLEFFTILFVLYFIVDISAKFYLNYQDRMTKLNLIREENKRTKAALEVKSQFLSTVSHELRTPLTAIMGGLDLAKSGVLGDMPEPLKPIINVAAKNGRQLAKLIDDLLDLQRIEAGEILFNCTPIDPNVLSQTAISAISGEAEQLGIQLVAELTDQACHISGDPQRLLQVMNNLLSNALKFSGQGSTVRVKVESSGELVRISVQDEGVGIPDDAKDRVFGKFSQVDSSDIRKVGGTGLGLNISKQIVERQGGTIDYVSELGVGSTFRIEFKKLAGPVSDHPAPNVAAE